MRLGVCPFVGLFCHLRRCVALEYGLVSLGLHCFLRLAHAMYSRSRRCLAYFAFSVQHTLHRIIVSFARVRREGVWFAFVGLALLLVVVLCWVDRCSGSWVLLGLFRLLHVRLYNDIIALNVCWPCLGHITPFNPPLVMQIRCRICRQSHHEVFCEKMNMWNQLRHDDLANTLHVLVYACSYQPAAGSCYRDLD